LHAYWSIYLVVFAKDQQLLHLHWPLDQPLVHMEPVAFLAEMMAQGVPAVSPANDLNSDYLV